MPRNPASWSRSTTARISNPSRVWRITHHSVSAASAATTNTASWSEFRATPFNGLKTLGGDGPTPWIGNPNDVMSSPARLMSSVLIPTALTSHSNRLGSITDSPMVPTTLAYTGALASRRSSTRSSASPSAGANTKTDRIRAATVDQCRP